MEMLPRIDFSRAEMMKRVARFKDLKGFDGGLPDSKMPGCERTLSTSSASSRRKARAGAVTSPVGDDAARLAAIKISEGFNLGYCRPSPAMRADDAQPRHQRDLHSDDRHLARELGERERRGRICRSRPARRGLVSARHDPPLRERQQGRSATRNRF